MTRDNVIRDAGFTLVEAMVSLFVFALIASGATLMLTQSVSAQARVGEAHERLREIQVAQALLNADLAQIVARPVRADEAGEAPALLTLVRASAEPREDAPYATALAHVEYVLRGETLVRRSRSAIDATAEAPVTERVLFTHIEDARLETFDGAAWRPEGTLDLRRGVPRALAISGKIARYGDVRIAAATGLTP